MIWLVGRLVLCAVLYFLGRDSFGARLDVGADRVALTTGRLFQRHTETIAWADLTEVSVRTYAEDPVSGAMSFFISYSFAKPRRSFP